MMMMMMKLCPKTCAYTSANTDFSKRLNQRCYVSLKINRLNVNEVFLYMYTLCVMVMFRGAIGAAESDGGGDEQGLH